eukprot:CAMPEP_0185193582 /NCGR_PEP_ID=MMETSP1140-20130426/26809_1 /TAXON_ID=298111 /ORGANISM="Pavlova sp., Strain CCMP459" /LENGTH=137 /DNA_ID=CAMNT_0027760421 /DNA_START=118 /DNA_END=532 /DNA_ORIENTATION=+
MTLRGVLRAMPDSMAPRGPGLEGRQIAAARVTGRAVEDSFEAGSNVYSARASTAGADSHMFGQADAGAPAATCCGDRSEVVVVVVDEEASDTPHGAALGHEWEVGAAAASVRGHHAGPVLAVALPSASELAGAQATG